MALEIGCFDLGVYCDFKARAESLEELVQLVRVHAREMHDLEELAADIGADDRRTRSGRAEPR